MAQVKNVSLKVGKMRKADECVIYPGATSTNVKIQGERLIMIANLDTKTAIANWNTGSVYPRFDHLRSQPQRTHKVALTSEQVEAIRAAITHSGDTMAGCVTIV